MEVHIKNLIDKYGLCDQRSPEWHLKRGEMLTASEIYKALDSATECQRHEIIMSKLKPKVYGEGAGVKALLWGTRMEPVAKEIYCKYHGGVSIVDTSCIPHPVYSFLGASPDGIQITADPQDFRYGTLIEIKCPYSRVVDINAPVPPVYYHQMQLQLECTGLQECNYVEFIFKEVTYTVWVDSVVEHKSLFAVRTTGEVKYKEIDDKRDVSKWSEEELGEDFEHWDISYWVYNGWKCVSVARDPEWLIKNIASFTKVWEEIKKHRAEGTLPDPPEKPEKVEKPEPEPKLKVMRISFD